MIFVPKMAFDFQNLRTVGWYARGSIPKYSQGCSWGCFCYNMELVVYSQEVRVANISSLFQTLDEAYTLLG